MRVVLVTPGYAPDIGGVETAVTGLARALSHLGCAVQVWTHGHGQASGPDGPHQVDVRRFPTSSSGRYPLSPALWAHTAREGRRHDVVHIHGYHSTAGLGAALGRGRLAVSPHYHGVGHTALARALHVVYRPVGSSLMRRAGAVIAVSRAERDLLAQDFAGLAERTVVVHHGSDTERIRTARPFEDQPPTVLVVGRLEAYKRVDAVIRAFGRCAAPGRLVVIGTGDDAARLATLGRESQRAADIQLLGRVDDQELARWYRTARAVVSISRHEAFGLVALEAAAGGARVLLSDIPAHREVATLVPAVLVGPTDAELVRALDDALAGPRGQATVGRTWDDCAREHLAVYERLAQPIDTSS